MLEELRARGFRVEQDAGGAADARARHPRAAQAPLQGHHGLQAQLPVAANVLERNFAPAAPNRVWTADMTYVWTDEGWLYLAVVLDLFNREIVGWAIKPRMTADSSSMR